MSASAGDRLGPYELLAPIGAFSREFEHSRIEVPCHLSPPYDVGSESQRFLVRATPQQQAAQALTVIVNWPALLKRGAAAR